jgi:transposase
MGAKRASYDSDISDKEWKIIRRYMPGPAKLGRPARYARREILNAILYLTRYGGAWRGLPHDLPPWRLVYYYFEKWSAQGLWVRLNDELRDKVRQKSAKKKPLRQPSSTRRRLKWLSNPENVATTLERRSREENATFWSIPWD